MAAQIVETTVGVVVQSNPNGVKLEGHQSWINWSKFVPAGTAKVLLVGSSVELGLDKAGFIREAQVLGGMVDTNGNGHHSEAVTEKVSVGVSRDTQIARMNALGHAVNIVAQNGEVTTEQVIAVAEKLVAWILG